MNADPLARWYQWLEFAGFGRALKRRREEFLCELGDARRALVLGDGDGRFLAAFLQANARCEVDAVDSSARMIQLARQRLRAGDVGRVRFHQLDATTFASPTAGYDLIITHFFLDCFDDAQLSPFIARLTSFAAPDARWVVSEFRQPAHGFAAWWAWVVIEGLYAFFRVVTGLKVGTLADYAGALREAGWAVDREVVAHGGLLISQLWRRL